MVPVIEIDTPANGAVYTPGQVVDASWSCGFDSFTLLGINAQGCKATAAGGSPIDTSPGTHTFTANGTVYSNGNQPVSASVTYTVSSGGGGGGGGTTSAGRSSSGFTFTVSVPKACVAPGGTLTATVATAGAGKGYRVAGYSWSTGHGKAVKGHPGSTSLPVTGLSAGSHTLTLTVLLKAKGRHHHKPKTRTVTLTVPFSVC